MERCHALVDAAALASLLQRLEPDGEVVETGSALFAGCVAVRSQEDPGKKALYVVAAELPEARADGGARWLKENRRAFEALATKGVSTLTVVFPGDWPTSPQRFRQGSTSVRFVSAAHHLWADRLRLHDDRGDLDQQKRRAFLANLGAGWSQEEERQYTEAALRAVLDGAQEQVEAREGLLRGRPDVRAGRVTVVYGPGGIGKTFFLRRVADRMTREALDDPLVGVPVFAELPLLLYTDALETWLSNHGVRLRLEQIRALVAAGVIVPVLDALDELVRGQAREGSRAFLEQLGKTASRGGRILLSSRDYYLNLDPLVREGIGKPAPSELTLGYFTKQGRRRYIQVRTGLNPDQASRWAQALEEQAVEALSGISEEDLESLIGHPLFLDAFCRIILDVPEDERAAAAAGFRIASPDVFGDIVHRVLEREEGKVQPGWEAKVAPDLDGVWRRPFAPELQQRVLTALVLMVARDGAGETLRRSTSDEGFRELYHGLFRFTQGVSADDGDTRKDILGVVVSRVLGEPEVAEHVPQDERDARRDAALDEYAGFLLQHTLSDTRPNLVQDLVFATRHRAYFDYLLADALLAQFQDVLIAGTPEARDAFIEWCLAHHIFERSDAAEAEPPFASCIDFVLWHRDALDAALRLILAYLEGDDVDDVFGSYVASLGLAVLLRVALRSGQVTVSGRSIATSSDATLELMENIVPAVSGIAIQNCSFGRIAVDESRLRDVEVIETEWDELAFRGTTATRLTFDGCSAKTLRLTGQVRITESLLDIEVAALEIDPTATLWIERCEVHPSVLEPLEQAARVRPDVIRLNECTAVAEDADLALGKGRYFVNKLMALLRRHGHEEFAVYGMKLRGRSGATQENFRAAVGVLERHGVVTYDNEMVYLTDLGEKQWFSGKSREGQRSYADVEAFWAPIVAELDQLLS